MPRKSKAVPRASGPSNGVWEYHTRHLLETLHEDRRRLASELSMVEERIDTVSSLMGRSSSAAGASVPSGGRAMGARPREGTIAGKIVDVLSQYGDMGVPDLVQRTGLKRGQVYPSLMSLKKSGRVKAISRGLYSAGAGGGSAGGAPPLRQGKAKRARVSSTPPGEASAAVMTLLKRRRNGMNKDDIVSATGLSRRQVHACLMTMGRSNQVSVSAKGVYKVRK